MCGVEPVDAVTEEGFADKNRPPEGDAGVQLVARAARGACFDEERGLVT